jgi:plastocyanin
VGETVGRGSIPSEPVDQATVRLTSDDRGNRFRPDLLWLEPGGTITFVVESGQHTVTAYAAANGKPQRIPVGATAFDSDLLQTGDSQTLTFDEEGIYDFFCRPHEATGMVGRVVVGSPGLVGPASAEPQSELPAIARAHLRRINMRTRSMFELAA